MTRAAYRVAIISPGQDTAGIGARSREALVTHVPDIDVVAVRSSDNYLRFPFHYNWDWDMVERLAADADLIHMHNHVIPRVLPYIKRTPSVWHHHGTIFREEPERHLREAAELDMVTCVSTIDLTVYDPAIRWLPSPINVDWMASLRTKLYEPHDRIRILHAPTNRAVKHTELFIETIRLLKARGLPVEGMLIEGHTWDETLKMKAAHGDILFDQLILGYGQNSLEAWAMGIPVVAGASAVTEKLMVRTLGELPYYRATPTDLARRLTELITSEDARVTAAGRGHEYVRRWHDNPRSAEHHLELYAEAAARKGRSIPVRIESGPWPVAQSVEPPPALPV